MMKLVIAEKPSVGVGISAVIGATQRKEGFYEGNGYLVSWCVGHLVGLVDASKYEESYAKWRRDDLPIIPGVWKYFTFDNKRVQFGVLKSLMNRKEVTGIICATDAGREGELIFRLVYQQANCKKPVERLWISSMEESAIRRGFEQLHDGKEFEPLYNSALCRAKADWLIGINATRLFSTLYGKTLNVGRVQSPTLAMLVNRHEKIKHFVKEKYHIVKLALDGIEAISEHIAEPEKAREIEAACQDRQAVCLSLVSERKAVAPPKLFDLTSLQRECNRLFSFTAKQTLDYAQKLYEGKLITYPRTDSKYLTSDMASGLDGLASSAGSFISVSASKPIRASLVVDDKKVTDHHAIIPTAEISKISASQLDVAERKILYLIAARFICAVGERHEYEAVTAVFNCEGHTFTTKGKVIVSNGWKEVDGKLRSALKLKGHDGDDEGVTLSRIMQGQVFSGAKAEMSEQFTQPPKAFTEDTLLSAMERAGVDEADRDSEGMKIKPGVYGLGTPATRASIIEKLVTGGFVVRKGRQLIPSTDGIDLVRVLPEVLKSPALTAEWENHLSLIADSKMSPDGFMRRIEQLARELVAGNTEPVEGLRSVLAGTRAVIGKCPRCGADVFEGKANFYCDNRDCAFVMWKNDRFFTDKKCVLTKDIASDLLSSGIARVKGLVSAKSGKSFDADVEMADSGGRYVNYRYKMDK